MSKRIAPIISTESIGCKKSKVNESFNHILTQKASTQSQNYINIMKSAMENVPPNNIQELVLLPNNMQGLQFTLSKTGEIVSMPFIQQPQVLSKEGVSKEAQILSQPVAVAQLKEKLKSKASSTILSNSTQIGSRDLNYGDIILPETQFQNDILETVQQEADIEFEDNEDNFDITEKIDNDVSIAPSQSQTLKQLNNILQLEKENHDQHKCCLPCRNIMISLLRKLDEVLLLIKLDKGNNGEIIDHAVMFDKLTNLPLNKKENLTKFDLCLTDPAHSDMKLQFIKKIECAGGDDYKKNIHNILSAVITDELAEQCTWMISKENKLKLQNFNFPNIIIDYVSRKHNVTIDAVRKRMQTWLQKSGDRIKLANKKNENKK